MRPPLVLKAGNTLIPFWDIRTIDIARLEIGEVEIVTYMEERFVATGFDAIEAVYAVKPSAMEGRRLRWQRHAWAFHNVIAHPVVQLLAWCGLKRWAVRFHDYTTPKPRDFRVKK